MLMLWCLVLPLFGLSQNVWEGGDDSFGGKRVKLTIDPDLVDVGGTTQVFVETSDGNYSVPVALSTNRGDDVIFEKTTAYHGEVVNVTLNADGRYYFRGSAQGYKDDVEIADAGERPTVTSVSVETTLENQGQWSRKASGFTFKAKIKIQGTGLDSMEIRQLIKSSTTWKDWNGQNMTVAQIMRDGNIPAWQKKLISTNGKFETDINWDWQGLKNRNAQNTQAIHYDDQAHNVTSIWLNAIGTFQVRRAEITRQFKIEIRDKATKQLLATHEWSYTWIMTTRYGRLRIIHPLRF
jgi:aryl carrier-like protein